MRALVTGGRPEVATNVPASRIPYPWLLADELIVRGDADATDAFAKAAPRRDVEQLPTFVAGRRGKPVDRTARAALASAVAVLAAKEFARALAILEGPTLGDDPIPSIRIVRAKVLARRHVPERRTLAR